jgi:tellurite methyltransferase
MSNDDRSRWDARYQEGTHPTEPSKLVVALDDVLPHHGRALDLAGGAGRHALWLARRGLDVTLCDISETALGHARAAAVSAALPLRTLAVDLETTPPPAGPWDLILSFHYLQPDLFARIPALLTPGGLLVVVQPTMKNLERHPKPSGRFLLEEGELPRLVQGLEIVRHTEGWQEEGRHEALLIARRS